MHKNVLAIVHKMDGTKERVQSRVSSKFKVEQKLKVFKIERHTRLEIFSRPKASKILKELLSISEEPSSPRPTKLLKNSKRFQKIAKRFKRFQKNPKDSKRFKKNPKDSKRQQLPKDLLNSKML